MICGFFGGGGWTLSPFFWVETENGRRSQGPQPFKLVQKGKKLQHKSCEIKSKIKNFYNNVSLDRSRFSLSINAAFVKAVVGNTVAYVVGTLASQQEGIGVCIMFCMDFLW